MKQARAWTSVEVTERLAAQPPPPPCVSRVPLRETRRADGVGDASRRRREDRTTHRPPPKPKQQTIGGPSIDFQEFVRRQGRDSSRRARKAEARQKEKPRECSFKPRLCENSKRMARNSKFDDRAAPASRESRRWRMREPSMRATRRRPEPPRSAAPPAHGERRPRKVLGPPRVRREEPARRAAAARDVPARAQRPFPSVAAMA